MELIAQLNDADTTVNISKAPDGSIHVEAIRCDGCSLPEKALDKTYPNLGAAIKAVTIFFVSEWESVFITNRLSDKMVDAIQAS